MTTGSPRERTGRAKEPRQPSETLTTTRETTNVEPVQVTFPTSGAVTLNAFPSHSYAWYLNNRFQTYDMTFIGTYQTVYIQDDVNNVHIDVDRPRSPAFP